MAITQRVKLGRWHNVYNRNKRLVGQWMVFEGKVGGFSYKGYTLDKMGEVEWDLSGSNPEYLTAIEASQAAIENIKFP